MSSFSRWIFGTRLNSCTWWRPRDLSWLGPPWAVSSHTERCCLVLDQGLWCGVGWPLGSCAALRLGCPTAERRPTVSWMTPSSHSKARHIIGAGCHGCVVVVEHSRPETGEKGSFGPRVVWIAQMEINVKVNKMEVRLPVKKNQEILEALAHIMDSPGGMVRHHEVRRIAGKISWVASFLHQLKPFVRQLWACLYTTATGDTVKWVFKKQVWPALTWLRMFHGQHQGELERHIFWWTVCWMASFWRLMQTRREVVLLVGTVIEGGHAMHHQTPLSAQFGHARAKYCCTQSGETPLTKQHGKPSWFCWIRHFVSPVLRGKIILVGDSSTCVVRHGADVSQITEDQ